MSNIIDELLKYDDGDIELPEKEFKMKLQKLGGKEFTFPLKALDPELAAEIQEAAMGITIANKQTNVALKTYKPKVRKLTEGCPTVFKSERLREQFKVKTPHELIKKLLTSGEIDDLVAEIDALSGYEKEEEAVEEVKN